MKKIIYIFLSILCFIPVQAVEVQWEIEISKENVVGVFQDTSKTRPTYYMVYYYNGKKTMASISKSEVQKYFNAIELGVDYHVIVQQLKTKKRVIIQILAMAHINKEYEHGYCQGYEYYGYAGGLIIDAQQEVIRRFNKRTLFSSYGKGFLQGFKDHREGKEPKYS